MPQQQNNLLGQPQNNSFGFNLGLGTQPVQQPSLFSSPNVGQVQNQNNNAIFGNSPQQMLNKSAVSLFNNTQPTGINPSTNATNPIFGGFQQNQPNTQAPTSIFGNTGGAQNNAGNSLFGNVPQTNTGQNGLFGSNNLNQTSSLFGQNNTTSPLFGNTANNPPANSLFGTTNYGQNFTNIPLNQGITQNSFLPDPNSFNRNI